MRKLFLLFLFLLLIKSAYGVGIAVSPNKLNFDFENRERQFMIYNPNNFTVEYSFSMKYNNDLFEFIPDEIKIKSNSYEKIKIRLNEGAKIEDYEDIIYIKDGSNSNIKTNIGIGVRIDKKRSDGKEFFVFSLVLLGGVLLYYRNRKSVTGVP